MHLRNLGCEKVENAQSFYFLGIYLFVSEQNTSYALFKLYRFAHALGFRIRGSALKAVQRFICYLITATQHSPQDIEWIYLSLSSSFLISDSELASASPSSTQPS